jgi:hypothetical protein
LEFILDFILPIPSLLEFGDVADDLLVFSTFVYCSDFIGMSRT